jgi:flagellar biosynthetic protein FliR
VTSISSFVVSSAALFVLVSSRVTGFVVLSPFPGQNVSRTQRISLVLVLAWIATTFAPPGASTRGFDLTLAAAALTEVACGLVIGGAFRLVFAVAEVFGSVVSQATGLGSASVLNPTIEAADTVIGRIVTLGALLIALAAGTHRVALSALLESFRALPIGLVTNLDAPMLRLAEVAIDAFMVGVQLSTPIVGVTLLVQLALALISRSAPSLQIFSVGFALLFTSGILTLVTSLDDLAAGFATHFARLAPIVDEALTAMQR